MTKLSPPLLRELLSIVASRPNIKNAANVIGVTDITVHNWIKRSRNSDPALLVDWPEGEDPRQFAEHMITARRMSLLQFESQIRDEVLNGRKRILRNASSGAIVYETDERFIGVSDDDMRLCGYDPPTYYRVQRNPDGSPVPAIVYDPPPAHLTIAVLTKAVNGYADTKHVSIDHAVHGVVRVGGPQAVQLAPPVLEAVTEDVAETPYLDEAAEPEPSDEFLLNGHDGNAAEPGTTPANEQTNGHRVDPGPRPDIVELRRLASLSPEERRKAFSAKPQREAERLWEPEERIGAGEDAVAPGGYQPSGPSPRYPRR